MKEAGSFSNWGSGKKKKLRKYWPKKVINRSPSGKITPVILEWLKQI